MFFGSNSKAGYYAQKQRNTLKKYPTCPKMTGTENGSIRSHLDGGRRIS